MVTDATMRIKHTARTGIKTAGDLRGALGAIREARGNLELLAKMLGLMKSTERDPRGDAPPIQIHTITYVLHPTSRSDGPEGPAVVEGDVVNVE